MKKNNATQGLTASAWTSVDNGLPDWDEVVLTYSEDRAYVSAYLLEWDGMITWYHKDRTDVRVNYVTHWQPLPEPPTTP